MRDLFFYLFGLFTIPGLAALALCWFLFKAARAGIKPERGAPVQDNLVKMRDIIRPQRPGVN